MGVPDFQSYMTPLLQLMRDGQERRITDIFEEMASHFGLSDDGNELAQLLIDHNIGVTSKQTYVIKRIDEDYFSEE